MSFEGFVQRLCRNGHYWEYDIYDYCPELCSCGEKFVWENVVDTTNGSYCECSNIDFSGRRDGCKFCNNCRIDGYVFLEVDKPPIYHKCDCCNSIYYVVEGTYKIPKVNL